MVRHGNIERVYDRKWQNAYGIYITLHPWCEKCLKQGKRTKAEIVDHIVPLKDGGERLDPRNMQSLCRSCAKENKT
jgi:5-methylcytosine-specific restriction protein A